METVSDHHKGSQYFNLDIPIHISPKPTGGESGCKDELGTLITAVIKFFLFQRSQIPMPYEKICNNFNDNVTGIPTSSVLVGSREISSSVNQEISLNDVENCRSRIQFLTQQRKRKALQRSLAVRVRKQMEDERKVRVCWDQVFNILQETWNLLSVSSSSSNMIGVVLMFGQTILNPRETIVLELDYLEAVENDLPKNYTISTSAMRMFFKNIIMSQEFSDYTSNTLQKTNAHLCVLTSTPIPKPRMIHDDLIPLNDFTLAKNRGTGTTTRRGSLKPIFHIKLHMDQVGGNMEVTNKARGDLFHNRPYSCYQIPFRFKGIQWRKQ